MNEHCVDVLNKEIEFLSLFIQIHRRVDKSNKQALCTRHSSVNIIRVERERKSVQTHTFFCFWFCFGIELAEPKFVLSN